MLMGGLGLLYRWLGRKYAVGLLIQGVFMSPVHPSRTSLKGRNCCSKPCRVELRTVDKLSMYIQLPPSFIPPSKGLWFIYSRDTPAPVRYVDNQTHEAIPGDATALHTPQEHEISDANCQIYRTCPARCAPELALHKSPPRECTGSPGVLTRKVRSAFPSALTRKRRFRGRWGKRLTGPWQ